MIAITNFLLTHNVPNRPVMRHGAFLIEIYKMAAAFPSGESKKSQEYLTYFKTFDKARRKICRHDVRHDLISTG